MASDNGCASRTSVRPAAAGIAFDVMATTHTSAAAIAALQAGRLRLLLQAALGTRFYRSALRGIDTGSVALSALPVADKLQPMRQFADRVTDPQITLDGLRAFCADTRRIGEPYLGRYRVWKSSGSTGQPGVFVQDETALAVYDALEALRRHSPRPLVRLVDPLYLGERFAFVGAFGGHFASHVSVRRLQAANPWLAQHSRSFSILQPTAALVAELNAFGPSIVATYPTAAVLLAEETQRGNLRIHPQEVRTGGETLSATMRARIEQGLRCALRNSYGASEFLPIAWECAQGRLHVDADWVILEAVDARHRPVPAGQASHTTLLTNLANHVQPLIRFDIGDRIVLDAEPCRCGCALPTVQVHGRRDDVLVERSREGAPVTLLPLALTTLLEDHAGVFDFQLCQHGVGHWDLTLGRGAAHTRSVREHCRSLLADFARRQGAVDLRIVVHVADALPLGRSGKLKRIVASTRRDAHAE
ncbi:MAG: CoF synthetase [Rubrivivax sp. SCN 70-15]|nr:MAG: CoF synthetase [Rubrivivax sp. SCN 70-15]